MNLYVSRGEVLSFGFPLKVNPQQSSRTTFLIINQTEELIFHLPQFRRVNSNQRLDLSPFPASWDHITHITADEREGRFNQFSAIKSGLIGGIEQWRVVRGRDDKKSISTFLSMALFCSFAKRLTLLSHARFSFENV